MPGAGAGGRTPLPNAARRPHLPSAPDEFVFTWRQEQPSRSATRGREVAGKGRCDLSPVCEGELPLSLSFRGGEAGHSPQPSLPKWKQGWGTRGSASGCRPHPRAGVDAGPPRLFASACCPLLAARGDAGGRCRGRRGGRSRMRSPGPRKHLGNKRGPSGRWRGGHAGGRGCWLGEPRGGAAANAEPLCSRPAGRGPLGCTLRTEWPWWLRTTPDLGVDSSTGTSDSRPLPTVTARQKQDFLPHGLCVQGCSWPGRGRAGPRVTGLKGLALEIRPLLGEAPQLHGQGLVVFVSLMC